MNLVVFSGPPSSGKTSVIIKTIDALKQQGIKVGVVKFDIQTMTSYMKGLVSQ